MVFACSAERVTKGGVGRATAQFSTQTDHNPVKSSITAQIQVNFQQFCSPFKIFFSVFPQGLIYFKHVWGERLIETKGSFEWGGLLNLAKVVVSVCDKELESKENKQNRKSWRPSSRGSKRTPNKWINHPRSVQDKNLQSRLINPAFHLLAKNNKGEEGWDLLEREEVGGGGGLTEDLQKFSQSLL